MAIRVTMSETGRITLPANVRKQMRLEANQELEVEVDESGSMLVLRPLISVRREEAWFFTPEHLARLDRALDDSREGRVLQLSEERLREMFDRDE